MSTQAPQPVLQRLQAIEASLTGTTSKLARGAIVTRVVGILLLCLLGGYFAYGYSEIKTLTDPKFVVPFVGNLLEDSVPEVRRTLTETVNTSAPAWAESLSTLAIQSAPQARQSLENYVLDQTSIALDNAATISEDNLRKTLRENRSDMNQVLAQLVKDEQFSEETLELFTTALDQDLGRDMRDQAHLVLGTLIGLKERLQHLSNGRSLSQDEVLERHTLMTIRYLQLREADEEFEDRIKKRGERHSAVPGTPATSAKAAADPANAETEQPAPNADAKPANEGQKS